MEITLAQKENAFLLRRRHRASFFAPRLALPAATKSPEQKSFPERILLVKLNAF